MQDSVESPLSRHFLHCAEGFPVVLRQADCHTICRWSERDFLGKTLTLLDTHTKTPPGKNSTVTFPCFSPLSLCKTTPRGEFV